MSRLVTFNHLRACAKKLIELQNSGSDDDSDISVATDEEIEEMLDDIFS